TCCTGWRPRRRRRESVGAAGRRWRSAAGWERRRAGSRRRRSWRGNDTEAVAWPPLQYVVEAFTPAEQTVLRRHVTNVDGPVFALVGLPETTRAALFARYSRSSKSLRRLLLDEFIGGGAVDASPAPDAAGAAGAGQAPSRDLFGRVLAEYGDD